MKCFIEGTIRKVEKLQIFFSYVDIFVLIQLSKAVTWWSFTQNGFILPPKKKFAERNYRHYCTAKVSPSLRLKPDYIKTEAAFQILNRNNRVESWSIRGSLSILCLILSPHLVRN